MVWHPAGVPPPDHRGALQPGSLSAPWPHGQAPPTAARAAIWLGTVAAAITALMGLVVRLVDESPTGTWLWVPARLTMTALLISAWRLTTRRGWVLLPISASGAVIILTTGASLDPELRSDGLVGVFIWAAPVSSVPLAAMVLSCSPRVRGWLADRP